jgi:Tol biopolymer transport system component
MSPIDGSSPPVHLNKPFHRFGVSTSRHQVDEPIPGEVHHFRISPDGSRVVYEADQDRHTVFELYTVPIDRSQRPRKLHPPLESGSVSLVGISPDSQRVLFFFLGGQLNSRAIDASGSVIALTEPPLLPGVCGTSPTITPDSSRVVFVAKTEGSNTSELFSVPLDGSQSPTRLSSAFPPGSSGFCAINTPGFKLSPEGDRVVYGAEQVTHGVLELFSVPVDGSAPPTRLNATLPSGGNVSTFEISSDGTRVVYGADQDIDGLPEVFAVPIDGSAAPVQINGPLVAGRFASFGSISPDGLRVLYWGDKDTDEVFELFSAPIRGGQSVKVNAPLVAGGDVRLPGITIQRLFRITPDGTRAVYVADQATDELFELHLTFLTPYARRR